MQHTKIKTLNWIELSRAALIISATQVTGFKLNQKYKYST
jgi:hypothetical protein